MHANGVGSNLILSQTDLHRRRMHTHKRQNDDVHTFIFRTKCSL